MTATLFFLFSLKTPARFFSSPTHHMARVKQRAKAKTGMGRGSSGSRGMGGGKKKRPLAQAVKPNPLTTLASMRAKPFKSPPQNTARKGGSRVNEAPDSDEDIPGLTKETWEVDRVEGVRVWNGRLQVLTRWILKDTDPEDVENPSWESHIGWLAYSDKVLEFINRNRPARAVIEVEESEGGSEE